MQGNTTDHLHSRSKTNGGRIPYSFSNAPALTHDIRRRCLLFPKAWYLGACVRMRGGCTLSLDSPCCVVNGVRHCCEASFINLLHLIKRDSTAKQRKFGQAQQGLLEPSPTHGEKSKPLFYPHNEPSESMRNGRRFRMQSGLTSSAFEDRVRAAKKMNIPCLFV